MIVLNGVEAILAEHAQGVAALGNFDGMHIGHQKILRVCTDVARQESLCSIVITFVPHPVQVLRPQALHRNIMSLDDKLSAFAKMGVDIAILIDFTEEFSELTYLNFIQKVLVEKLQVAHVITGRDFFFGRDREGNADILYKSASSHGFTYQTIEQVIWDYHDVSSSNIKRLMKLGAFGIIRHILGREYAIAGEVMLGRGMAKSLGVPTANIALAPDLYHPLYGVYLVQAEVDGINHYGVANIGKRPTFLKENDPALLEVHFFHFEQSLYGRRLEIKILHFIRPERSFDTVETLKLQIQLDIKAAQQIMQYVLNQKSGSNLLLR